MTTLRITVNNRKNAHLLSKLLKSMAFVKNVEEEIPIISTDANQFVSLKNILDSIEPDRLFLNINNPVEWQKKIRDEWETH